MPIAPIIIGLFVLGLTTAAEAGDKVTTTTIQNGNNSATITQNGDPATTSKKVEKRPGYTHIEQQTGKSRTVIVQSTDGANIQVAEPRLRVEARDRIPPDVRARLSPEMRRLMFGE